MVSSRGGRTLSLEKEEFDERTTQAFRRPAFSAAQERARANVLFRRVAELLDCSWQEASQRLLEPMLLAEAVPHAFSRVQLAEIAPAVLDLIERDVPAEHRKLARDMLRQLLQQESDA
jgi:hypothetical protein